PVHAADAHRHGRAPQVDAGALGDEDAQLDVRPAEEPGERAFDAPLDAHAGGGGLDAGAHRAARPALGGDEHANLRGGVGGDLDRAAVGPEPDPEVEVEDEPPAVRGWDALLDLLGAQRRGHGEEPEERERDRNALQTTSLLRRAA